MSRPSLVMAQLDAFKEYEGTLQLLNVQDDHHKILCEFFYDFLLGCPNEEGICRGLMPDSWFDALVTLTKERD